MVYGLHHGKLWKLLPAALLTAALGGAANGRDLCQSGHMISDQRGELTEYVFRDFPQVAFETSSTCNSEGACEYKVMFRDVQKTHVVRHETIEGICSAFRRTEKSRKNNLHRNPHYRSVFGFTHQTDIAYRLEIDSFALTLVKTTFHRGTNEPILGHWHGSDSGGEFLRMNVTTYEIGTSWKY